MDKLYEEEKEEKVGLPKSVLKGKVQYIFASVTLFCNLHKFSIQWQNYNRRKIPYSIYSHEAHQELINIHRTKIILHSFDIVRKWLSIRLRSFPRYTTL